MNESPFALRLAQAQQEQLNVFLHCHGAVYTGLVARIADSVVELRFSGTTILVRIDRIDAISSE